MNLSDRHMSTISIMQFLRPNPNLPEDLKALSQSVEDLANYMLRRIPDDSPELTVGLRKLLEAKDCFVRCGLIYKKEKG